MTRLFTLVGAALLLACSVQASAETRIGVVDLRQALFSSDDAQSFSQQLEKDFGNEEAKVRQVQQEAQKLQERLQKDGAMMNEAERKELSGQFQRKVQEFNQLKQRLDATVNQRKQQFVENARPEVDAAIKELLEENNLDLILPSEAVVYAKPDMNLTEALLNKLNE
ncbi:OmpH family outer membrane protein [Marinobacter persicus]|uniref:Periplasmic chaperone for outer membrane proteins Skp n=1 Tax=Marinobacter persicus TaxID=930118 RepID=A0A2S6G3M6_9GAMM|nr:OmpH family outer membrane protein [Marinobacter persicus]PPK50408.1 periplasmic chaperone for outer membrane proteins Skp [Marinobacter persicus]PPK53463.1 periplasmic chaperone for outer membrane proteins Skp [Marinobacter persicus]PPK56927.1 periplasmic chaperone for outer membrane proteins Skp [Marinobacter persicus]